MFNNYKGFCRYIRTSLSSLNSQRFKGYRREMKGRFTDNFGFVLFATYNNYTGKKPIVKMIVFKLFVPGTRTGKLLYIFLL